MDDSTKTVGGISCCGVFLISVILFGCSFAVVHPLQMGIALNHNIMTLDTSTTYYGGRHFVGIGRSYILYPITYQTVQLGDFYARDKRQGGSIKCRTLDGMVIHTDISFSYRIMREPENLIRLYRDVEDVNGWESLYTKMATQSIRDVTSKFLAFDFFTKRNAISEMMKSTIHDALKRVYATVHMFELVNLEIDPSFAMAIELTQVEAQDILQAQAEREVAVINAQSELAVRTAQAEILVANAEADAFGLRQTANAEAAAIKARMTAQVAGYKQLSTSLNMTSHQLLAYQFISTVDGNNAGKVLLNIPYPSAMQMS